MPMLVVRITKGYTPNLGRTTDLLNRLSTLDPREVEIETPADSREVDFIRL
jgi:hypothetical protein